MPTATPPVPKSKGRSKKECIYFKRDDHIRIPAPRKASSCESIESHAREDRPLEITSPTIVEAESSYDLYNAKLMNYIEMAMTLICEKEFEIHFYATEGLVEHIHKAVLQHVFGDKSNMIMSMVVAVESEYIPTRIWKWFNDRNRDLVARVMTILEQRPAMIAAKQMDPTEQQAILWNIQTVQEIAAACDLGFIDFQRAVMYVRGCMILYLRQP